MIKKSIVTALALLPMMLQAQNLQVMNANIDLGQILYNKSATATFMLKNSSQKTVKISDIDTGCECSVAEYPKYSIMPGAEVPVSINYDARQLGHFSRSIMVYDDNDATPLYLTLSGHVVTEIENYTGEFPYAIGDLLTDINEISFDDVHKAEHVMQEIHVMNPTGQYVEPVLMHMPNYLRAEVSPSRIAPKKSGVIRLSLNTNAIRTMGLSQTTIFLGKHIGEKVSEDKEIPVSIVLLPEQVAQDDAAIQKSARCTISTTTVDFSNFAGKSKMKSEVIIQNTGKSNLEIQSMQMFTRGIEVVLPKRTLKPGELTKMRITGIAKELAKVRQRPRILMITNDMQNPKTIIEIKK